MRRSTPSRSLGTTRTLRDVEGDALTIVPGSVSEAVRPGGTEPVGTVAIAGGSLVFTPIDPDFTGDVTFTYQVSDGTDSSNIAFVTLTIRPVNEPPVAQDDTVTRIESDDDTYRIDVLANDTDVDNTRAELTISAIDQPAEGTVTEDPATPGTLVFVPTVANFVGTVTFDYTISDPDGATDTATVTLTISDTNDAPVAVDDTFGTPLPESDRFELDVLANDTDVDNISATPAQPANAGLSVVLTDPIVATNGPGGAAIGSVTAGTGAGGSPVLVFTPDDPNYNGAVSFTYRVTDGVAESNDATVSFVVAGVNDPPVARPVDVSIEEDDEITVQLFEDGYVTDVDLDYDESEQLTFGLVAASLPDPDTVGTATIDPTTGALTFRPVPNFTGTVVFDYTVDDGDASVSSTVTIRVSPVNDPPVASPAAYTTDEDTLLTGSLFEDGYVSDPDSETLTFTLVDDVDPAVGALTLNPDGTFSFQPAPNVTGEATFTYTVSDGQLESDVATVRITIEPVNDLPVVRSPAVYPATEDQTDPVQGDLIGDGWATDADPGDTLRFTLTTDPTTLPGTLVLGGFDDATNTFDGTFTFTLDPDFDGTVEFGYRVSDGSGTRNGIVRIPVAPVDDAPVAADDTLTVDESNDDAPAYTVPVVGNDTDAEGDALTIVPDSITPAVRPGGNEPVGTVAIAGGSLVFTPTDPDFTGAVTFTYQVTDGTSTSNSATVTLTITPVDDPPVAVDDTVTSEENQTDTYPVAVLENDTDVDNTADELTVTAFTQPADGVGTVTRDATDPDVLVFRPTTPNFTGTVEFTYTVSDPDGGTDTATVSLTITNTNDAPVAVDDPFGDRPEAGEPGARCPRQRQRCG